MKPLSDSWPQKLWQKQMFVGSRYIMHTGRNVIEVMVGALQYSLSHDTQFQFLPLLVIFILVPWLK